MPNALDKNNPQIDAKHPDYGDYYEDWELIADCIAGQRKIKDGRTQYLPHPGTGGAGGGNKEKNGDDGERYNSYLKRANFLNFTDETKKNLVGQCFAVDPVYSGPKELEPFLQSIDGAGVSALQQSKCALAMVLSFSRCGLFTDYPKTEGIVSQEDVERGDVAPKVILYKPSQIINWDTIQRGARTILSLVMLEETYVSDDDGYKKELDTQWRELRLIDGVYSVKIWRRNDTVFEIYSQSTPTDGSGSTFDEIPFQFIGAEANN